MNLYFFENNRHKRIALVDKQNKIQEFFEFYNKQNKQKGDIYYGTIKRIEPKLNAVFVNFDEDKDGFLPVSSIHPTYFNLNKKDRTIVFKEVAKKYSLKQSSIYTDMNLINRLRIGQEILVQVTRPEKENKGVMLSSFLSLQGRYVKYIPNSITEKIIFGDRVTEEQMDLIHSKYRNIQGSLSVKNTDKLNINEIFKDIEKILKKWQKIQNFQQKTGSLVYSENSAHNIISNLIEISSSIIYEGPNYKNMLQQYQNIPVSFGFQIFRHLEKEISQLNSSIVQLNSGAYMILEQTFTGLNVDINMGCLNKHNIDDSSYATNKIALKELFRQIHLRHIGGIIIVDLISMQVEEHKKKIMDQIKTLCSNHPMKINYSDMNIFGMVTLCCQYSDINKNNYETCHYCNKGQILNAEVSCNGILREISYLAVDAFEIHVHIVEKLMEHLFNYMFDDIEKIKKDLNVKIKFILNPDVDFGYKIEKIL